MSATTANAEKQQKVEKDSFYMDSNRRAHTKPSGSSENLYLEAYSGYDWGDKLSFTVGCSYVTAGSLGILRGIYLGFPKNFQLPRKLLLNNFFNAVGKESSRYGNAAASASLIYSFVGGSLNLFFEDELAALSHFQKNIICGAITGSIYKSTLGIIPAGVGALLGAASIGSLTTLVSYLNNKGYVSFEMKF